MQSPYTPLTETSLDSILSRIIDEGDGVFLETNKFDQANFHSLLFLNPHEKITFATGDSLDDFFLKTEGYLDKGYFLAGWCAYEFGYFLEPALNHLAQTCGQKILAEFGVYSPPFYIDHSQGSVNNIIEKHFGKKNISHNIHQQESWQIKHLRTSESQESYLEKIEKIKAYITAGDTYQVNYTLKYIFDFLQSPTALYKSLRRNQSVSYGAFLQSGNTCIQSFSPELFFKKKGNLCTVRPMKGTCKRGKSLSEDKKKSFKLQQDSKNRSENVMIVDLLRNDLGKISSMGEVKVEKLFQVETYETLHQMTSSIHGHLKNNLSLQNLFKSLFPCGSVTGAPKIRTMEIINELECQERGVYTGTIGYISPNREMAFNVPIRTVVLKNNRGEMGIGSGIVHDSNPEKEWQECLLKGRFLTSPLPDFQIIETVLWTSPKGYFLLTEHLDRMAQSAQFFLFPFCRESLRKQLEAEAAGWKTKESGKRVRILLYRNGSSTITVQQCPMPDFLGLPPRPTSTILPKVALSGKKTDPDSVFLYHKTTNRSLYEQEFQRAKEMNLADLFFCNTRGELTEGAISTILIEKKGVWFTPPLSSGILPGTMREYLLKAYEDMAHEKILYPEDLADADQVCLVNSVRGVVPVHFISDFHPLNL